MDVNPYESPRELGEPKRANALFTSTWAVAPIVALPCITAAVYCVVMSYRYATAIPAEDHPYVTAYLKAGLVFIIIGAFVVALSLLNAFRR